MKSEAKEFKIDIKDLPQGIQNIFYDVSKYAKELGYEVYAVGGFVRDLIQGKVSNDIDFVIDKKSVDNPAITFVNIIETFGIGMHMALYKNFGTAKLAIHGIKCEFVMPRGEEYDGKTRKPKVKKINIKDDALRRDFTINTLMLNIKTGEVLDPTGKGRDDLNDGILRSANPDIDKMLQDDYLRCVRAIRFSACKNFKIDLELRASMITNIKYIDIISRERIKEELDKILMVDSGDIWLESYTKYIMGNIIPELVFTWDCMEKTPYHWNEDTYKHTIRTIYNCPKDINIRRAALFHDIGKPAMRTIDGDKVHFYGHDIKSAEMAEDIMRKLTYSNDEIKIVKLLIANHMRPHLYKPEGCKGSWGDKAVRKYIIDVGNYLNDSIALACADSKGSGPEDREKLNFARMKLFEEHINRVKTKPIIVKPIIGGDRLMEIFNCKGGPWIKDIINYEMEILYEFPEIQSEELEAYIKEKWAGI